MRHKLIVAWSIMLLVAIFPFEDGLADQNGFNAADLYDPTKADGAFDLANTPWWLAVFQYIMTKTSDTAMKAKFDDEFSKLSENLNKELADKKYGTLIKVQLYADESGTPVIPDGQLLAPIGNGMEPIDALAEYIRNPKIYAPAPSSLKNQSYYIWIKSESGTLKGGMIPRDYRESFQTKALKEAQRRDLIADWQKILPEGVIVFKRDEFWGEVAKHYAIKLSDEKNRKLFAELQQQFNDLEERFNEDYVNYQRISNEMVKVQQYNNTLQSISSVMKLLSQGIKEGSVLFSEKDAAQDLKIKTDYPSQTSADSYLEVNMDRLEYMGVRREKFSLRAKAEGKALQDLNDRLNNIFKQNNIIIPSAPEQVPVLP